MRRWPRFPGGPIRAGVFRFVFGLWVGSILTLARPVPTSGAFIQDTQPEDHRTVWDGVYAEAQAERGRVLYTEACATCHAPDLRGNNTSPSLVGMSFTFLWGGFTLGALFDRIQERMPPARPGALPAPTYRDILAFILHANGYPTGTQELAHDRLDAILITEKPGT